MYKHEEIATEITDGGVLYSDTVHLECRDIIVTKIGVRQF